MATIYSKSCLNLVMTHLDRARANNTHKSVAVVITIIQIPPSIPVSNNGTYKQNTEQTKQTPKIDFKRLVLVVFYSSTTYMYKVFIHILFYQSIYEMKLENIK